MSDVTFSSLTPDSLRQLMQETGYRAEPVTDPAGVPRLASATAGLPFEIRFGNLMPNGTGEYADVTFIAALRVQGTLPPDLINTWNNTKRFGRLHLNQDFLFLDMDVTVVGGVNADHLRAQIQIWDRLVQELLPYLRNVFEKLAAATGAEQQRPAAPEPRGKASAAAAASSLN
jgi:Putative bacterial sensory transduction regulator